MCCLVVILKLRKCTHPANVWDCIELGICVVIDQTYAFQGIPFPNGAYGNVFLDRFTNVFVLIERESESTQTEQMKKWDVHCLGFQKATWNPRIAIMSIVVPTKSYTSTNLSCLPVESHDSLSARCWGSSRTLDVVSNNLLPVWSFHCNKKSKEQIQRFLTMFRTCLGCGIWQQTTTCFPSICRSEISYTRCTRCTTVCSVLDAF